MSGDVDRRPLWERAIERRELDRRAARTAAFNRVGLKYALTGRGLSVRAAVVCCRPGCQYAATFGDPKKEPLCKRHWLESLHGGNR